MVQAVKLAQNQVRFQIGRLQLRNGLVFGDGQLQHLLGLRTLHVVQGAEVHFAEQYMGLEIVRVLLDLVLRACHRLANAADFEVKLRQTVLKVL